MSRVQPFPDCRQLAYRTAWSLIDILRAGQALDALFVEQNIKINDSNIPNLIPPYPKDLLSQGGMVDRAISSVGLDVNQLRHGPMQTSDQVNIQTCLGLVAVAKDISEELLKSNDQTLPAVVWHGDYKDPVMHPKSVHTKVCLPPLLYPYAFAQLVAAYGRLTKKNAKTGELWDKLQGTIIRMGEASDAPSARLYIDMPTNKRSGRTYRKDLTIETIKAAYVKLGGDPWLSKAATTSLDWWDIAKNQTRVSFVTYQYAIQHLEPWPTDFPTPKWDITGWNDYIAQLDKKDKALVVTKKQQNIQNYFAKNAPAGPSKQVASSSKRPHASKTAYPNKKRL